MCPPIHKSLFTFLFRVFSIQIIRAWLTTKSSDDLTPTTVDHLLTAGNQHSMFLYQHMENAVADTRKTLSCRERRAFQSRRKKIHSQMRGARVNSALSKNPDDNVSSQPIYVIVNKSLPMRLSSHVAWRWLLLTSANVCTYFEVTTEASIDAMRA